MSGERESEQPLMPEFLDRNTTVEGDLIVANVGADAEKIVVGKNINDGEDFAVVDLVIRRDIAAFSIADQAILISTIERLLGLSGGTVKVIKKSAGSVVLSLKVPEAKMRELIDLVMYGTLAEFDVVEIKVPDRFLTDDSETSEEIFINDESSSDVDSEEEIVELDTEDFHFEEDAAEDIVFDEQPVEPEIEEISAVGDLPPKWRK